MDKQELRNALSAVEDEARQLRSVSRLHDPRAAQALSLVARLTQLVREEIVK